MTVSDRPNMILTSELNLSLIHILRMFTPFERYSVHQPSRHIDMAKSNPNTMKRNSSKKDQESKSLISILVKSNYMCLHTL